MRTAAQRRYAEKNKEALRVKDTRSNHHNAEKDAESKNQRNSDLGWRWMRWGEIFKKRVTLDYGRLSFVNQQQAENPTFVITQGGKRCYERLYSPLPLF
jgi:hypothetical protein